MSTAIDSVIDYGSREAWLVARRQGVGASESAALFDLSPYHSRLSLWLEKTGKAVREEPTGDHAERLRWGLRLEPLIAAEYEERTKRKLWHFSDFCIAQHPEIACMLATPDRFILEAPDRSGEGELQIKNTANVFDDTWADGPPPHVLCQVQHELAVTGRDFAAVGTLANGNRLLTWDIERNEDFISELQEQVRAFWELVESGTPPPVDGHRATLAALKRLHPMDNGEEVALEDEAVLWLEALKEAKADGKSAEARKDAAEAWLRNAIGPHTFGRLSDGRLLSLKHTTVKAHVVEYQENTYRALRELKADGKAAAASPGRKRRSAA